MLNRFLARVRLPRPPRSHLQSLPTGRVIRGVAFCALAGFPLFIAAESEPELPGPAELQSSVLSFEQRPAWEDAAGDEVAIGGGDPLSIVQLQRSNLFTWPAEGLLTSYFGQGHPTGIDIGLDNDIDTPIWAAADGVVEFAGGTTCCDYGLFVILEHETGFTSLYAHLSKLNVKPGQFVKQGEQLGLGGATGDATGKHLHFELLAAGHFVDPLRYLSARQPGLVSGQTPACGDAPVSIDAASQVRLSFGQPDSGVEIEEMSLTAGGAAAPRVVTNQEGQTVSIDVPPVAAATSRTYAYDLAVTLKLGEERRELHCAMALATMPTLANPPSQIPLHAARSNAIQALQAKQKQQQQQYEYDLWLYQQSLAKPEPTPTPDLTALLFQAQSLLQAANSGAPPPQAPVYIPPQAQGPVYVPPPVQPTLPATATPTRTPTPSKTPASGTQSGATPTPAATSTAPPPSPTPETQSPDSGQ
jgi:hypothetical protein